MEWEKGLNSVKGGGFLCCHDTVELALFLVGRPLPHGPRNPDEGLRLNGGPGYGVRNQGLGVRVMDQVWGASDGPGMGSVIRVWGCE